MKCWQFQAFFLSLLIMPVVGVALLTYTTINNKEEIKSFGAVPEFSLVDQFNEKVGREDLDGKIWVANFIFTHCSGQCPMLNFKFKRLQKKFKENVNFKLVSFSADPLRDTPEVLEKYAKKMGADQNVWLFLTGSWDELGHVMRDGFKVASSDSKDQIEGLITHSFKFVLVDRWNQIRGYFDGTDDADLKRLEKKINKLLIERF